MEWMPFCRNPAPGETSGVKEAVHGKDGHGSAVSLQGAEMGKTLYLRGMVAVKVVPTPSWLWTSMRPP